MVCRHRFVDGGELRLHAVVEGCRVLVGLGETIRDLRTQRANGLPQFRREGVAQIVAHMNQF